ERGVYVGGRDGSNVHRVSGPGYAAMPAWSPDSKQLAFVRAPSADADVWNVALVPIDNGGGRLLANYDSRRIWSAAWFPDGKRIAFARADRLVIMNVATREAHEFLTPVAGHGVREPLVAPDGRTIAFQVVRNGVWLLDAADGSMRCAVIDPTAEQYAWSADGRRL